MKNVLEKNWESKSKHILCSVTFFRENRDVWENMENYGTAGKVTHDNIIGLMRFACWITNVINIIHTQSAWLTACFAF